MTQQGTTAENRAIATLASIRAELKGNGTLLGILEALRAVELCIEDPALESVPVHREPDSIAARRPPARRLANPRQVAVILQELDTEPTTSQRSSELASQSRIAALQVAGLTARQLAVLNLVGSGNSNRVIATRLGITERTVKFHVTQILRRLGVGSRLEAALCLVTARNLRAGP